MKELGIYIHIPFCARKCLYCDFLSFPAPQGLREGYVRALCEEIRAEAWRYRDHRAATVFFGGGTPSLLSGAQMAGILHALRESFRFAADAEITMEMNPGTVTEKSLAAYRDAGVNRASLGLQSADNGELARLGRIHTWEDFLQSYALCRRAGFENINIDLMSALPGQTYRSWMETLRRAAALGAEHISAYSLIIEEGTPFYDRYGGVEPDAAETTGAAAQEQAAEITGAAAEITGAAAQEQAAEIMGAAALPDEETERAMYAATERYLSSLGYERYEISNYAEAGRRCAHNCVYWQRGDYVGFGLGAASMVSNVRWSNVREMEAYLEAPAGGKRETPRPLSVKEQMEETMYLGLRMTEGVSREAFKRSFGYTVDEIYGDVLRKHEALGLLRTDGGRIRLTGRGIDVSNCVLADFLLD